MRKIKLEMGKPFPSYVDISIIDVTEEKERKRAGVTADYSDIDLKPMLNEGKNLDEIVAEYDKWLNNVLRRYLLDECEIVSGHEEFLSIIRESVSRYFK